MICFTGCFRLSIDLLIWWLFVGCYLVFRFFNSVALIYLCFVLFCCDYVLCLVL